MSNLLETIKIWQKTPNQSFLIISGFRLTLEALKYLSFVLKENHPLVKFFYLTNNMIGDQELDYLTKILEANDTITHLDLSNNKFGAKRIEYFGRFLEKTTAKLTFLNVTRCYLGNEAGKIIGSLLEGNNTLTNLILCYNYLGDNAAKEIAKGLEKNTNLLSIDLSENEIGDEGVENIAKALRTNKVLKSLNLNSNKIKRADDFIWTFKKNSTLISLHLKNNLIDVGLEKIIVESQKNRDIEENYFFEQEIFTDLELLIFLGKIEEALLICEQGIKEFPEDVWQYQGKITILKLQGKFGLICETFDKYLARNRKDLNFWKMKIEFLENQGMREEILKTCDKL